MFGSVNAITWNVLLDCGITELPVRVSLICKKMGVHLCSYGQGYKLIRHFRLGAHTHDSDGFLFRMGGVPVIFYNQSRPVGRQRFTVAHELGHLVLGHKGPLINREPSSKDNPVEREANVFAANLLAPACVLRGLGVHSAFGVAEACGISGPAATFRMEQLQRLYDRDAAYLRDRGRSYFFQSPLEWKLYCQFEPFIREKRAENQALLARPDPAKAPRPCGGDRPTAYTGGPSALLDRSFGWSSHPAP